MDYKSLIIRLSTSIFLICFLIYLLLFNDELIQLFFNIIYIIILFEILLFFKHNIYKYILYLYIIISFIGMNFFFSFYFDNLFFIFMILSIASFDTFSYIFGSLFGKKKIFNKISPNKTYFGLFSGFICAIFCTFLFNLYFDLFSFKMYLFIILSFIFLSFIGDMIESKFKRISNLRNSSNFLPGHGGFFDRFDSFILCIYLPVIIRIIFH